MPTVCVTAADREDFQEEDKATKRIQQAGLELFGNDSKVGQVHGLSYISDGNEGLSYTHLS